MCSQSKSFQNVSRVLSVAAVGVAAAGMIAGSNLVQAIELPQLPLPSLPSLPMPGLPEMSKLGGEQQPKDSQTNLTDEEEGKVDDMMSRLEAKKRARATKM